MEDIPVQMKNKTKQQWKQMHSILMGILVIDVQDIPANSRIYKFKHYQKFHPVYF